MPSISALDLLRHPRYVVVVTRPDGEVNAVFGPLWTRAGAKRFGKLVPERKGQRVTVSRTVTFGAPDGGRN